MTQQLVSLASALENAGNDRTLVRDLVDVFLESSAQLVEDLETAARNGDSASLARAAHSFKSPLGFFGATDSVALAQTIESTADHEPGADVTDLVQQLLVDVRQVHQELRQFDC